MSPASGTAAASSNETFAGFAARDDSEAHAYSARDPRHSPKMSSPGLNWVTLRPMDATRPATSRPGRAAQGLRRPRNNRVIAGRPLMRPQSLAFNDAARTWIRTSLFPWSRLIDVLAPERLRSAVTVTDIGLHEAGIYRRGQTARSGDVATLWLPLQWPTVAAPVHSCPLESDRPARTSSSGADRWRAFRRTYTRRVSLGLSNLFSIRSLDGRVALLGRSSTLVLAQRRRGIRGAGRHQQVQAAG